MLRDNLSSDFKYVYDCGSAEKGKNIILNDDKVRLLIIDENLPGLNGSDFTRELRSELKDRYIYIIMITGYQDEGLMEKAYKMGVDDFLKKPFNIVELKSKIISANRIIEKFSNLENRFEDVYFTSIIDGLTGTYNKTEMLKRLSIEFEKYKEKNEILGVVFIDIDFFKKINDTYGHLCGDYVLTTVSEIIKKHCRKYDIVGRFGGEEFVIICPNTSFNSLISIAERIRSCIKDYNFIFNDKSFNVTISAGIAVSFEANSAEELLELADKRLYISKQSGRDRVTVNL